ncbi:MAG: hypothetical protein HZA08_12210 [Nitrospirae bacterium]|nr:hypothetical protein [Nitrospirota bacterium]
MRSTQRWPEDEMHKCIGYFMTDPKGMVLHVKNKTLIISLFLYVINFFFKYEQ